MKLPPAVQNAAERFNRMTLRERVLVFGAVLAALIVTGDTLLIQPVAAKETRLTSEIEQLNKQIAAAAQSMTDAPDATSVAQAEQLRLETTLKSINDELSKAAAGLIPAHEVAQMLHEVLRTQQRVKLVSLHNEPVRSLIPTPAPADGAATPGPLHGPFSHPIVMIVEGSYLDVLEYLRKLESMSFRVYWNRLELQSTEYPVNRVRIEISTLSMDPEWLGV